MSLGDAQFTKRKERMKALRTVVQAVILAAVLAAAYMALFTTKEYLPYDKAGAAVSGDRGFIALSYFGVDRVGSHSLIGVERLRGHLQALKDNGYVTVTQQDIESYYAGGKELPEKSLFLMFEDGRRDTAIFSEKTLEDLNFKATALTYTEKFALRDTKFLSVDDLKDLKRTTFWEMGSNGHRLAFINVFDRYGHYLGELTPLKYSMLTQYLGRDYNHYLMDYIRDENRLPKESYLRMKERIDYDYQQMAEVYSSSLGEMPGLYVLMHSNTGSFGNDPQVSAANEYWIRKLFKMNFNREGFCLNQRKSSIYDLTRMQPQAYWPANHLLMRIKGDTGQEMAFVRGDEGLAGKWLTVEGAAEFKDEAIFLTSLPEGRGLLYLKDSGGFYDMALDVRLRGNRLGQQRVYLRADDAMTRYLAVGIVNNKLVVSEKTDGAERELFFLDLGEFDGVLPVSIYEDEQAALTREMETFRRYADSGALTDPYLSRLKQKREEKPASVADGAPKYVPELSPHSRGDRKLSLNLKGNSLEIFIDGRPAANLKVTLLERGGLYLASAWGGYGWSQRNIADDVYDAVFEGLVVKENVGEKEETVLFDARYKGFDKALFTLKKYWEAVIDWFVMYL